MQIKIIDRIGSKWALGSVSLWDYLSSLKTDNFEYDIQRGIVTNKYLDSILDSVYKGDPLPPISLESKAVLEPSLDSIEIDSKEFNILDGLQRTYRLWLYKQIYDSNCKDYKTACTKLKGIDEDFSKAITLRQIKALYLGGANQITISNLKQHFSDYNLYLYIWFGLSEKEAIKKMLILNAGQKRMSLQNQFELMYLHTFDNTQWTNKDVKLYRAKDPQANAIGKGTRKSGEYLVTSAIIGLQSLIAAKPVRLSSDLLYKEGSIYDDDLNGENYITITNIEQFFDESFISTYLDLLYTIDEKVCRTENLNKWFVKDTTISGIMGGIGRFLREKYSLDIEIFNNLSNESSYILSHLDKNTLNLDGYELEYQNLSSVRINIGLIVRKAICEYTYSLIKYGQSDWGKSFAKILGDKKK